MLMSHESTLVSDYHLVHATCLVTDAEGFSSAVERMPPRAILELVNQYFEALFEPILEHGGRVMDIKGDGMLAIFVCDGDDALARRRACLAAVEAAGAGVAFDRRKTYAPLRTRIGIQSGQVALAHVGTDTHREFRAVGDPVNTASRLEQLNRDLGTQILVSGTIAEARPESTLRRMGVFWLRGKQAPVDVFEILDGARLAAFPAGYLQDFDSALRMYEAGHYGRARSIFERLEKARPDDGPVRYFKTSSCERMATKTSRVIERAPIAGAAA